MGFSIVSRRAYSRTILWYTNETLYTTIMHITLHMRAYFITAIIHTESMLKHELRTPVFRKNVGRFLQ